MRLLIALLITLSLLGPAWAGDSRWSFSMKLSNAGPLCVASVEKNGVTVGFYSLPFGPTNAFVSGVGLPRNAKATWQVSGYEWRQFTGAADRYNGFHFYPGIAHHFLGEVAAGSKLNIYLHDASLSGNVSMTNALDLPLRGSAQAITSLMTCQSGYSQVVYPAMLIVETHWYLVPLH